MSEMYNCEEFFVVVWYAFRGSLSIAIKIELLIIDNDDKNITFSVS